MKFPSWYYNGNYKTDVLNVVGKRVRINGCPYCEDGFTNEGKACEPCKGSSWSSSCPIYDKPTTIKYSDFQTKILSDVQ